VLALVVHQIVPGALPLLRVGGAVETLQQHG
jgi:hypothetical protein